MSDEPTERLELRITKDLWDAIDKLAKNDGRHITSMARLLIERGLMITARPQAGRRPASLVPIAQRWGLDKPRKRPR